MAEISSRAASGCRWLAAYRLSDSFTSATAMPGQNGSASGPTNWSPVMTATGTPKCCATKAFSPASPVTIPLSLTLAMARGLYVWESTPGLGIAAW